MERVIIADDSATARMVIKRCLEIAGLAGAEFLEAANGLEALELLEWGPPDLLVTDLTMPVMGGLDLLKRLKQEEEYRDMPVLVISSAKNDANARELIELGAFAVLPKPVNPAMLAEALAPLLPAKGGAAW
ncbi:response regulator [Paucidesulfovibrio longus]|uniref:response regulator n=1 Tax=Paucidesulfovibrio longus TaxID=889 RepID=UPI0006878695|nr:response regulator [Paucidesulfovibrio longus]